MIAYAYIANGTAVEVDIRWPFHWHGKRLSAICSSNDTSVSVGLLAVVFMCLNKGDVAAVEFLIPLHRTEICC